MHNKLARILKKLKNLPGAGRPWESYAPCASAILNLEDLVVRTHFAQNFDNSAGRFVDVGAFHPFKYSNTMLLSQLGWRGINIDCNPVKIAGFKKLRPRDHNICAAVGEAPRDMIYLEYSPEGLTNRIVDPDEKKPAGRLW